MLNSLVQPAHRRELFLRSFGKEMMAIDQIAFSNILLVLPGYMAITHDFSGSGSWTFTAPSGSSFGDIVGKVINNDYSRWEFRTTYYNYSTNSMQIGVEYSKYLDTWNGKNWYFYSKKVTANEWHYWIKGSF